jgi:hypothetical protein
VTGSTYRLRVMSLRERTASWTVPPVLLALAIVGVIAAVVTVEVGLKGAERSHDSGSPVGNHLHLATHRVTVLGPRRHAGDAR